MRTFILILCIVAVIVGGTVIYLVATTPHTARPLRFPLTPSQLELLGRVPATADAYGYIPAPAALHRTLLENPVTREPLLRWSEEYPLPPAFLLGRADAAIWKSGKVTSYAVRLDPFRAMIVRVWLLFSHASAHFEGNTLLLNADDAAGGAPEAAEATGLPEGDVFVVQRSRARGAFPPIGRPALTSVRVTPREIVITSRSLWSGGLSARRQEDGGQQEDGGLTARRSTRTPFVAKFPRNAMLSVAFNDPPRILGDFHRLLGADVEAIAGEGGLIALYKVETGTLLPRPKGVIVVPANGDSRAALARYRNAIDLVGETVERNGEVVVSFDRTSAGQYGEDVAVSAAWPATEWAVRIDPAKLVPVLRKTSDNAGLRLLTPRIHRGTRDLRRWIDALERAASIEAALSRTGEVEELRARVTAK